MKKIVQIFTALLIFVSTSFNTCAQDYNTGIGIRFGGFESGLTVKHFTNSSSALEGILGWGYHSFILTGLYEKHNDINTAPGLKWFYGGGGHIGFFNYGTYYNYYENRYGHIYYVSSSTMSASVVGLDFILGLDYKFPKAPINVGLDVKPFIDFFNGLNGYFDGALSLRFAF